MHTHTIFKVVRDETLPIEMHGFDFGSATHMFTDMKYTKRSGGGEGVVIQVILTHSALHST